MHAGENFYESTLRMMDGYPNLFADLGDELWLPIAGWYFLYRGKVTGVCF
jgi:hypothetical protein